MDLTTINQRKDISRRKANFVSQEKTRFDDKSDDTMRDFILPGAGRHLLLPLIPIIGNDL